VRGRSTRIVLVAVGALAGFVGTAVSARAAASCSVEALNVLHVPDVSITDAKPMAAAGTAPAYCDVQGTVVTKGGGVADGLARFAMQLPEAWQQRFLFFGVGGNAGNLVPSANDTDRSLALAKGYTTILTDTGQRRRRHWCQVDAPAGRQTGHGEEDRFLLSRRARRHRRRKGSMARRTISFRIPRPARSMPKTCSAAPTRQGIA
jgi:hypothetical protein